MSGFQQFNTYDGLTSCRLAATGNISGSYTNGSINNGVGAQLILASGTLTIDGVTVELGDRLILPLQTNANENGIYVCTQLGTVSSAAILQRAADFQCIEQIKPGQYTSIAAGDTNAGAIICLVEPLPQQFGIDDLTFSNAVSPGEFGEAAFKDVTDNTKPLVVSMDGIATAAHVAVFADTAGTIEDGGVLGNAASKNVTDNTKPTVPSLVSPIVQGNVCFFANNSGSIEDLGVTIADPNATLIAMLSLIPDPDKIIISAGDGSLTVGPVNGNVVMTSSIITPDVGANLVSFDVTVTQAQLAAGGIAILFTSINAKQYKVRSLQLNRGGTNFSGGGGDRDAQVTDGVTSYSVIPAATMQSLVNAQWGATALPNPGSAAINTSTQAGVNLTLRYSGGTTDYTAGSLTISGILQRVA
jgi:hypothetical protein